MITFLDHNDVEYGAQASITITNGVNGERSISGTVYVGDDVIHGIDRGWRLRFEGEYYAVIYADPIDIGNQVEVKFDAVHQFFYDFQKSSVYGELNGSHTMLAYLNFIFQGSGYDFNLETTVNAFEKENFGYKSRLELFNDIITSTGVEFVVYGRVVRILNRVGTDLSTVVKKGFNLNELSIEKNIGEFITYKRGFGAFFDEDNPSAGRLEVEYESPLASVYGRRDGSPVVDERYTVEQNLYNRIKDEVDNSYTISVSMDLEDLTKAGYTYDQPQAGDYIMAINDDIGFKERVRIVQFQSDYDVSGQLISHKVICNDIGSIKKQSSDYTRLENSFLDLIAKSEDKFLALVSANGRNRNYYGSEFPKDEPKGTLVVGDQLWLEVGEETKRYYWNGEEWIIDPFSEDSEWVKKEVERVAEEAEKLADDITEAYQKADDAKRDAGLALTASEALEIITQETASQLSDTRGLLTTVESNASEAWAKADSALSQAGQAITDAYTAQTTAQSAISQAQSALSKANSVEETTNSLVIDVDNLAGEVSLKADSSTVNTLSGTVSSQGTTLTQQAGLIASKANQSTVDTLSGKVSDHTTTLSQHATAINARLTQSQVDNLVSGKGYSTVSYVDNKISATADGISAELTRVEGKIPTNISTSNLLSGGNTRYNSTNFLVAEWDLLDVFEDNEEVTISFRGRTGSLSARYSFYYGGGSIYLGTVQSAGGWQYQTMSLTFKWKNIGSSGQLPANQKLRLYSHPQNNGYLMAIDWIVLMRGKLKVKEFVPAVSEMVMDNDFTIFKNAYSSTIASITSELSKTAKTTDLAGMVTESYLATNQYAKQGEINAQLQSYLKTTDLEGKVQETTAFQDVKATTDRFTRVIGSTDAQAKSNIAQIVMTDSLFSTTVRNSVEVGGRNYFSNEKNAKFNTNNEYTLPNYLNVGGFAQFYNLTVPMGTFVGQEMVLSFECISPNGTTNLSVYNTNGNVRYLMSITGIQSPINNVWTKQVLKVTVTDRGSTYSEAMSNKIEFYASQKMGVKIRNVKFEKGNKATDWTPPPEDLATSQQLSDIKQTADSIQALVGTTNESVARAVMTSSLWETEVSKVIDSELKQQYKTITSQVANVTRSNDAYFGVSASGYSYYDFDLETDIPSGTKINVNFFLNISNNQGQQFKLDYISSTGNAENILSMNLTRGRNNVTTSFVASKDYSSNGAKLRLRMYDYSNYIVYFEVWHEAEIEIPILGEDTGAISSQITQLYNMINLSILGKDGAMSRIAMGEEGIQIDGKLLHITAKTFIDDAVIKSAMIEALDAGKITTGQLDASLVRVVNLDANSIAGNEASFIRALFTGTRSILQITGNRLSVVNNDGFASTIFESDGMSFYGKGKKVASLQYQAYAGGSTSASSNFLDLKLERDTQLNLLKKNSKTGLDEQFIVINGSNGDIHTRATIRPSANNDGIQLGGGSIGNTPVVFIHSTNGGGIAIGNQNFFYKVAGGSWKRMS